MQNALNKFFVFNYKASEFTKQTNDLQYLIVTSLHNHANFNDLYGANTHDLRSFFDNRNTYVGIRLGKPTGQVFSLQVAPALASLAGTNVNEIPVYYGGKGNNVGLLMFDNLTQSTYYLDNKHTELFLTSIGVYYRQLHDQLQNTAQAAQDVRNLYWSQRKTSLVQQALEQAKEIIEQESSNLFANQSEEQLLDFEINRSYYAMVAAKIRNNLDYLRTTWDQEPGLEVLSTTSTNSFINRYRYRFTNLDNNFIDNTPAIATFQLSWTLRRLNKKATPENADLLRSFIDQVRITKEKLYSYNNTTLIDHYSDQLLIESAMATDPFTTFDSLNEFLTEQIYPLGDFAEEINPKYYFLPPGNDFTNADQIKRYLLENNDQLPKNVLYDLDPRRGIIKYQEAVSYGRKKENPFPFPRIHTHYHKHLRPSDVINLFTASCVLVSDFLRLLGDFTPITLNGESSNHNLIYSETKLKTKANKLEAIQHAKENGGEVEGIPSVRSPFAAYFEILRSFLFQSSLPDDYFIQAENGNEEYAKLIERGNAIPSSSLKESFTEFMLHFADALERMVEIYNLATIATDSQVSKQENLSGNLSQCLSLSDERLQQRLSSELHHFLQAPSQLQPLDYIRALAGQAVVDNNFFPLAVGMVQVNSDSSATTTKTTAETATETTSTVATADKEDPSIVASAKADAFELANSKFIAQPGWIEKSFTELMQLDYLPDLTVVDRICPPTTSKETKAEFRKHLAKLDQELTQLFSMRLDKRRQLLERLSDNPSNFQKVNLSTKMQTGTTTLDDGIHTSLERLLINYELQLQQELETDEDLDFSHVPFNGASISGNSFNVYTLSYLSMLNSSEDANTLARRFYEESFQIEHNPVVSYYIEYLTLQYALGYLTLEEYFLGRLQAVEALFVLENLRYEVLQYLNSGDNPDLAAILQIQSKADLDDYAKTKIVRKAGKFQKQVKEAFNSMLAITANNTVTDKQEVKGDDSVTNISKSILTKNTTPVLTPTLAANLEKYPFLVQEFDEDMIFNLSKDLFVDLLDNFDLAAEPDDVILEDIINSIYIHLGTKIKNLLKKHKIKLSNEEISELSHYFIHTKDSGTIFTFVTTPEELRQQLRDIKVNITNFELESDEGSIVNNAVTWNTLKELATSYQQGELLALLEKIYLQLEQHGLIGKTVAQALEQLAATAPLSHEQQEQARKEALAPFYAQLMRNQDATEQDILTSFTPKDLRIAPQDDDLYHQPLAQARGQRWVTNEVYLDYLSKRKEFDEQVAAGLYLRAPLPVLPLDPTTLEQPLDAAESSRLAAALSASARKNLPQLLQRATSAITDPQLLEQVIDYQLLVEHLPQLAILAAQFKHSTALYAHLGQASYRGLANPDLARQSQFLGATAQVQAADLRPIPILLNSYSLRDLINYHDLQYLEFKLYVGMDYLYFSPQLKSNDVEEKTTALRNESTQNIPRLRPDLLVVPVSEKALFNNDTTYLANHFTHKPANKNPNLMQSYKLVYASQLLNNRSLRQQFGVMTNPDQVIKVPTNYQLHSNPDLIANLTATEQISWRTRLSSQRLAMSLKDSNQILDYLSNYVGYRYLDENKRQGKGKYLKQSAFPSKAQFFKDSFMQYYKLLPKDNTSKLAVTMQPYDQVELVLSALETLQGQGADFLPALPTSKFSYPDYLHKQKYLCTKAKQHKKLMTNVRQTLNISEKDVTEEVPFYSLSPEESATDYLQELEILERDMLPMLTSAYAVYLDAATAAVREIGALERSITPLEFMADVELEFGLDLDTANQYWQRGLQVYFAYLYQLSNPGVDKYVYDHVFDKSFQDGDIDPLVREVWSSNRVLHRDEEFDQFLDYYAEHLTKYNLDGQAATNWSLRNFKDLPPDNQYNEERLLTRNGFINFFFNARIQNRDKLPYCYCFAYDDKQDPSNHHPFFGDSHFTAATEWHLQSDSKAYAAASRIFDLLCLYELNFLGREPMQVKDMMQFNPWHARERLATHTESLEQQQELLLQLAQRMLKDYETANWRETDSYENIPRMLMVLGERVVRVTRALNDYGIKANYMLKDSDKETSNVEKEDFAEQLQQTVEHTAKTTATAGKGKGKGKSKGAANPNNKDETLIPEALDERITRLKEVVENLKRFRLNKDNTFVEVARSSTVQKAQAYTEFQAKFLEIIKRAAVLAHENKPRFLEVNGIALDAHLDPYDQLHLEAKKEESLIDTFLRPILKVANLEATDAANPETDLAQILAQAKYSGEYNEFIQNFLDQLLAHEQELIAELDQQEEQQCEQAIAQAMVSAEEVAQQPVVRYLTYSSPEEAYEQNLRRFAYLALQDEEFLFGDNFREFIERYQEVAQAESKLQHDKLFDFKLPEEIRVPFAQAKFSNLRKLNKQLDELSAQSYELRPYWLHIQEGRELPQRNFEDQETIRNKGHEFVANLQRIEEIRSAIAAEHEELRKELKGYFKHFYEPRKALIKYEDGNEESVQNTKSNSDQDKYSNINIGVFRKQDTNLAFVGYRELRSYLFKQQVILFERYLAKERKLIEQFNSLTSESERKAFVQNHNRDYSYFTQFTPDIFATYQLADEVYFPVNHDPSFISHLYLGLQYYFNSNPVTRVAEQLVSHFAENNITLPEGEERTVSQNSKETTDSKEAAEPTAKLNPTAEIPYVDNIELFHSLIEEEAALTSEFNEDILAEMYLYLANLGLPRSVLNSFFHLALYYGIPAEKVAAIALIVELRSASLGQKTPEEFKDYLQSLEVPDFFSLKILNESYGQMQLWHPYQMRYEMSLEITERHLAQFGMATFEQWQELIRTLYQPIPKIVEYMSDVKVVEYQGTKLPYTPVQYRQLDLPEVQAYLTQAQQIQLQYHLRRLGEDYSSSAILDFEDELDDIVELLTPAKATQTFVNNLRRNLEAEALTDTFKHNIAYNVNQVPYYTQVVKKDEKSGKVDKIVVDMPDQLVRNLSLPAANEVINQLFCLTFNNNYTDFLLDSRHHVRSCYFMYYYQQLQNTLRALEQLDAAELVQEQATLNELATVASEQQGDIEEFATTFTAEHNDAAAPIENAATGETAKTNPSESTTQYSVALKSNRDKASQEESPDLTWEEMEAQFQEQIQAKQREIAEVAAANRSSSDNENYITFHYTVGSSLNSVTPVVVDEQESDEAAEQSANAEAVSSNTVNNANNTVNPDSITATDANTTATTPTVEPVTPEVVISKTFPRYKKQSAVLTFIEQSTNFNTGLTCLGNEYANYLEGVYPLLSQIMHDNFDEQGDVQDRFAAALATMLMRNQLLQNTSSYLAAQAQELEGKLSFNTDFARYGYKDALAYDLALSRKANVDYVADNFNGEWSRTDAQTRPSGKLLCAFSKLPALTTMQKIQQHLAHQQQVLLAHLSRRYLPQGELELLREQRAQALHALLEQIDLLSEAGKYYLPEEAIEVVEESIIFLTEQLSVSQQLLFEATRNLALAQTTQDTSQRFANLNANPLEAFVKAAQFEEKRHQFKQNYAQSFNSFAEANNGPLFQLFFLIVSNFTSDSFLPFIRTYLIENKEPFPIKDQEFLALLDTYHHASANEQIQLIRLLLLHVSAQRIPGIDREFFENLLGVQLAKEETALKLDANLAKHKIQSPMFTDRAELLGLDKLPRWVILYALPNIKDTRTFDPITSFYTRYHELDTDVFTQTNIKYLLSGKATRFIQDRNLLKQLQVEAQQLGITIAEYFYFLLLNYNVEYAVNDLEALCSPLFSQVENTSTSLAKQHLVEAIEKRKQTTLPIATLLTLEQEYHLAQQAYQQPKAANRLQEVKASLEHMLAGQPGALENQLHIQARILDSIVQRSEKQTVTISAVPVFRPTMQDIFKQRRALQLFYANTLQRDVVEAALFVRQKERIANEYSKLYLQILALFPTQSNLNQPTVVEHQLLTRLNKLFAEYVPSELLLQLPELPEELTPEVNAAVVTSSTEEVNPTAEQAQASTAKNSEAGKAKADKTPQGTNVDPAKPAAVASTQAPKPTLKDKHLYGQLIPPPLINNNPEIGTGTTGKHIPGSGYSAIYASPGIATTKVQDSKMQMAYPQAANEQTENVQTTPEQTANNATAQGQAHTVAAKVQAQAANTVTAQATNTVTDQAQAATTAALGQAESKPTTQSQEASQANSSTINSSTTSSEQVDHAASSTLYPQNRYSFFELQNLLHRQQIHNTHPIKFSSTKNYDPSSYNPRGEWDESNFTAIEEPISWIQNNSKYLEQDTKLIYQTPVSKLPVLPYNNLEPQQLAQWLIQSGINQCQSDLQQAATQVNTRKEWQFRSLYTNLGDVILSQFEQPSHNFFQINLRQYDTSKHQAYVTTSLNYGYHILSTAVGYYDHNLINWVLEVFMHQDEQFITANYYLKTKQQREEQIAKTDTTIAERGILVEPVASSTYYLFTRLRRTKALARLDTPTAQEQAQVRTQVAKTEQVLADLYGIKPLAAPEHQPRYHDLIATQFALRELAYGQGETNTTSKCLQQFLQIMNPNNEQSNQRNLRIILTLFAQHLEVTPEQLAHAMNHPSFDSWFNGLISDYSSLKIRYDNLVKEESELGDILQRLANFKGNDIVSYLQDYHDRNHNYTIKQNYKVRELFPNNVPVDAALDTFNFMDYALLPTPFKANWFILYALKQSPAYNALKLQIQRRLPRLFKYYFSMLPKDAIALYWDFAQYVIRNIFKGLSHEALSHWYQYAKRADLNQKILQQDHVYVPFADGLMNPLYRSPFYWNGLDLTNVLLPLEGMARSASSYFTALVNFHYQKNQLELEGKILARYYNFTQYRS